MVDTYDCAIFPFIPFYSLYLLIHTYSNTVLGPVPERPISANPGLKVRSIFVLFPTYALLGIPFCVIITVSRSKD